MTIRNLFNVQVSPDAQIKSVYDARDLSSITIGDVIAPYDDYLLEWDEDCVLPAELEQWRHEGDPLCDDVVRALDLRPGQDGLQAVLDNLDGEKPSECVVEFWKQISREPPDGITAFIDNDKTATPAISSCSRHPLPSVSEGQAVFWRYSSQIFSALLHYSLAGGFSADRVVGVLRETNYLTGEDRDKTYRRLLETTQAVTDYMNDLTPVTGQGWKSAVRVRILHASVRVRLADKRGAFNVYDPKVDGVPINQEDLLATLGSFAIAPLWTLQRQGIRLTPEEEMAHVAVWRHIGYYLGISPTRLERYYRSVSAASKVFACNTIHLFSFKSIPSDHTKTSTYRLLSSVAHRPPRNAPVDQSLALSRFFLGDGLADRLALPRTDLRRKLRIKFNMAVEKAMVQFGRVWTRRWEVERIVLTRLVIRMIVCWQLGVRRTKFTQKMHFDREEEKLVPGVDDDELDPEVTTGVEAGRAVVRRYKLLLAEMGVVIVVPLVSAVGLGLWMWKGQA